MKTPQVYRYSPRPMADYRLEGVPLDEVSIIETAPHSHSIWNLFWLCNPMLDRVPGSGDRWHRVYRPTNNLLHDVCWNVYNNGTLDQKLLGHPSAFSEWFQQQPLSDFKFTYPGWADPVLKRANEVGDRLIMESPPVVINDNIVYAKFGRVA